MKFNERGGIEFRGGGEGISKTVQFSTKAFVL